MSDPRAVEEAGMIDERGVVRVRALLGNRSSLRAASPEFGDVAVVVLRAGGEAA